MNKILSPTSGMKVFNVPRGGTLLGIIASGRFPVVATDTKGIDTWVQIYLPGVGYGWVLQKSGTKPPFGVLTDAPSTGARVTITRDGHTEEFTLAPDDEITIKF